MSKPLNAVLIVTAPAGWQPRRMFDLPPSIESAEFFATRLPISHALTFARIWNEAHLPRKGRFDGRWAVVLRGLKKAWQGRFDRDEVDDATNPAAASDGAAGQEGGGA